MTLVQLWPGVLQFPSLTALRGCASSVLGTWVGISALYTSVFRPVMRLSLPLAIACMQSPPTPRT